MRRPTWRIFFFCGGWGWGGVVVGAFELGNTLSAPLELSLEEEEEEKFRCGGWPVDVPGFENKVFDCSGELVSSVDAWKIPVPQAG